MSKSRWIAISAGCAVAAVLALAGIYSAWRHVPRFYIEALSVDDQIDASNELIRHASALASDARRTGSWKGVFTVEQINAWLAVDMPRNHPDLLPYDMHEPRVAMDEDRVRLAFRYGQGPLSTVCTATIGVCTIDTNTVALRIERVRGGRVPLPMGQILNMLSSGARKAKVPLEWRRVGGDPVAILRWLPLDEGTTTLVLDNVEVTSNELFVAGMTQWRGLAEAPSSGDSQTTQH